MKLNFKQIHIENFLSIENLDIDFSDYQGFISVKGRNKNVSDNARSNGSGKSSIFEAISWCLLGQTIRGTKDVKRIGSELPCLVRLSFLVNNDNFLLERSKNQSQSLKLYINGEDQSGKGIKDTEAKLSSIIPDITAELLGSVVIMGQGLPQRFTNNTPSGRKDVLEKLSKSDFMICDLKSKVDNRKVFLNDQFKELEKADLTNKTSLSLLSSNLDNLNQKLSKLNMPDQLEIDKLNNDILTKGQEYDRISQTIADQEQLINDLQDQLIGQTEKYNSERIAISNDFQRQELAINSDISKLLFQIKALEEKILEFKNIKDICPTCGQKIPGVLKKDTSQLEQEVVDLRTNLEANQNSLKKLKEDFSIKNSSLKQSFGVDELRDKLMAVKADLTEEKGSLNRLQVSLSFDKDNLAKLVTSQLDYSQIKSTLEDEIEDTKLKIQQLQDEMLYSNTEMISKKQHIDVISKFENLLKRDFRGYLLKNVISFIDQKAKEYSNYVFNTSSIDFQLDGNNISIIYSGKEYENLSGGEKQKVDLIIQLSIREMLCKFLDFSSNILVFDEMFDNLDDLGCEKVLNLISNKVSDVSSIFIITHHQNLQLPIDKELIVEKDEYGASHLV